MVEPWLRGTLGEVDSVKRQVLHGLVLAGEDVERWCAPLTEEELEMRPFGLAPVGFHLRHLARSLDRLMTYAEGNRLSAEQLAGLSTEMMASRGLEEFRAGLAVAMERLRGLDPEGYEDRRSVGRENLPSTVGGLLVHCAEHTQRHLGQAITTAKLVTTMGRAS